MIILERIASGTATQFRSSRNSTDSQSHENRPSGGPPLGPLFPALAVDIGRPRRDNLGVGESNWQVAADR
jgi:hypothetical protein